MMISTIAQSVYVIEILLSFCMTGVLPKYTGGQVYYYPAFQARFHGEKFSYDLTRDLSRETAWEAVMRIRCGKGI